jgi:signal transduction histidine kinase
MNVRTKIALLLLLIIVVFTWGLVSIERRDEREFAEILRSREAERTKAFDQFYQQWGERLDTFVNNVTCWDPLVAAIANSDLPWCEANLTDSELTSFRSQAVWVYNKNSGLFFTRNVLYSDNIPEAPLETAEVTRLIQERKPCHFFAWTAIGLMEVRGASIHPSQDAARATAAEGYFFAGRVCTKADLNEMSLITGDRLELLRPKDIAMAGGSDPESGTVSFIRALPGWDGKPVAALRVTNESPEFAQMRRSSVRGLKWLMVFALVVFLIMSVSLLRWVTIPLRTLSESLRRQDPAVLGSLDRDKGELGDFARLISQFFTQRQELLREMEERRVMEEALHKSEEQLRHSQKMDAIGQLAGGIAHDFNNLLTAIIGYSEMLLTNLAADEDGKRKVDVILKAGKQAASLTRQLLAFSRKQVLQPRVVDLNELLSGLQQLLQRLLGETIQLKVEQDAHPALVMADPTQLEQVVINLCVNARDAMPQGGVLTLRTTEHQAVPSEDEGLHGPRLISLCVADEGIGMDARTRERIFEPFYTTKEVGKGTGLGLATVYGIVQQSGGTISVESEVGKGTTFHVVLPEATGEVERVAVSGGNDAAVSATETLLVVEDEEIVREFVCAALSDQGYHVLSAVNGDAGLQIAGEYAGQIDLLITDVIMPGMNGPELSRQLSDLRPGIPVLFVSGYSDNDLAKHGTLPSEINFLEKPFSPASLNRKVRDVLDGSMRAAAGQRAH